MQLLSLVTDVDIVIWPPNLHVGVGITRLIVPAQRRCTRAGLNPAPKILEHIPVDMSCLTVLVLKEYNTIIAGLCSYVARECRVFYRKATDGARPQAGATTSRDAD